MKKLIYLFAVILFGIISSCSKEQIKTEENSTAKQSKIENDPTLTFLKQAGFSKTDIKEFDEYYLVEGDITFYKNKIYRTSSLNTKQRQYSMVTNIEDINVYIDPSMSTSWISASEQALARWNNIENICLHFNIVESTSLADIHISYETNLSPNTLATASWPSPLEENPNQYKPGQTIEINPDANYPDHFNQNMKIALIMHEIGHTIGLAHTNDSNFELIPGTPSSDPDSLMNTAQDDTLEGSSSLIDFSTDDIIAIKTLFQCSNPNPSPEPDPLSVLIGGPLKGDNQGVYTWNAIVDGGISPYSYEWKRSTDNGQTYTYPWGDGTESFTANLPLDKDLYIKVIVTDANGNTASNTFLTLNESSGGFKP